MEKKIITLTEQDLHKIVEKSVKELINENLNDIMVVYNSPTKGNNRMLVKSLKDAYAAIPSDATYFDITKGSNSSEEENLINWGGKNGYWDNKSNPDFKYGERPKPSETERILRKRKW